MSQKYMFDVIETSSLPVFLQPEGTPLGTHEVTTHVAVFPDGGRGFFEIEILSIDEVESGGLWFTVASPELVAAELAAGRLAFTPEQAYNPENSTIKRAAGRGYIMELNDFDGVHVLSSGVAKILRENGFIVDEGML